MSEVTGIRALFDEILKLAVQKGASDVHLKANVMPVVRKHGTLRPLSSKLPALTAQQITDIAYSLMNEKQRALYEEQKQIDMGYGLQGVGRFRLNIFLQRSTIRMVIRSIPQTVPTIEELQLPATVMKIANQYERGMVLVTGATGSGKSSTMAAMIDQINRTKNLHILTIEDPIEFLIRDRKSIISQRELGVDANHFTTALKSALRQDPDVILIGEMRDRETIETALAAAETGHLVISTLHTLDATETINRILVAFEPHQQNQIRLQLGSVLKAVVSQRLAKRKDDSGFVPAVEIMINNARIREMIEEPGRTKEIHRAIEEGRTTWGMQTFDQSLMDLISDDLITYDEALSLSTNPEDFAVRFGGISNMEGDKKWQQNSRMLKKNAEEWQGLEEIELEMAKTNIGAKSEEPPKPQNPPYKRRA